MSSTRYFMYPPPASTEAEAAQQAEEMGHRIHVLDRGPDGLTRGICEIDKALAEEYFERKRRAKAGLPARR